MNLNLFLLKNGVNCERHGRFRTAADSRPAIICVGTPGATLIDVHLTRWLSTFNVFIRNLQMNGAPSAVNTFYPPVIKRRFQQLKPLVESVMLFIAQF